MATRRLELWVLWIVIGCGSRTGLLQPYGELEPSDTSPTPGGTTAIGGTRAVVEGGRAGVSSGGGLDSAGRGGRAGSSGSGGALSDGGYATGGAAGDAMGGAAGEGAGAGGDAPVRRAVEVAAGAFHSCALFDDGSLRCWGYGDHNGLALNRIIGDDEPASSAPDVDIGGPVQQLTASWYHTCAILSGGRLRCFGNSGRGRLGYTGTETIGDDESPASAGDVRVGGEVTQVAAGTRHSCAVLADQTVRCWGDNEHWQLGSASPAAVGDDEAPADVPVVDVGGPAQQVSAGAGHSCALLTNGRVRCWGTGGGGRLGYGNEQNIGDDESPASAGDVELGGKATQIVSGESHSCALLEGGKVRCWGRPYFGVLGYGNLDIIGDNESPASAGDVDLGGPAQLLSAGARATCALLEDGRVRCWGAALLGELGHQSTEDIGDDEKPASVSPVDVGGSVTHLDVGYVHVCVTLVTGSVRCWGRGSTGALGYGNPEDIGDDEAPSAAGDVPLP